MFKRSLALMLAILTVFALSAPAFAADEPAPEDIVAPIPEEPAEAEAFPVDETPADEPAAAAALPTEEVVHERLMAMQEVWPDGSHWDHDSYYVDRLGYREYACFGFAIMLQEAAFPDQVSPYRMSAPIRFEDVWVGDMLSTPGHTGIVVETHEDYLVMADGNTDRGVHWGRIVRPEDMGQFQYRWTYYTGQPSRYKNGWLQEDGEWFFYEKDVKVTNQWREDNGGWCFLGDDGRMLVGLQLISLGEDSDGWYYFNPARGGSYGSVMTGWQQIDGDWYYFNESHDGAYGRMVHNEWRADGNTWNYLGDDGRMATGLRWAMDGKADDGLYYLDPTHNGTYGTMLTGWRTVDGYRYYFETKHNGKYGIGYVNGTYTINGVKYTFDAWGRLAA